MAGSNDGSVGTVKIKIEIENLEEMRDELRSLLRAEDMRTLMRDAIAQVIREEIAKIGVQRGIRMLTDLLKSA